MGFCIHLSSTEHIGLNGDFQQQLDEIDLLPEWQQHISCLHRPGSGYDDRSLNTQGKLFCHLHGIAVIVGQSVLMSRVPKHSGYVARYLVLESVLLQFNSKEKWDKYFLGSAFVLLDNDGVRQPSNWGIYWHDVDRFFSLHELKLRPLLRSELPIDALLNVLRGNLKLSNLHLCDEQLDIARLATHGLISNEEALERLKILRSL